MKIKSLKFKNINSYGNKIQNLNIFDNDEGSLMLITGKNGSGKSSIKQALELCLFGKVQGKSGKRLSLIKLPNRRNGNLQVEIEFENNTFNNVLIKRSIKPNKFEININDEDYYDKFKKMSEESREKIIGCSFDLFKSFISLNMNDFKNFIALTKDDKENLLNKLFNIDKLDKYYSITSELKKNNIKLINDLKMNYENNKKQIIEYENILKNFSTNTNIKNKIETLKNTILEKKPHFESIQNNIEEINNIILEINSNIGVLFKNKNLKQIEQSKHDMKKELLNEKINHFNNGICPICETNLKDNIHVNKINELKNELVNIETNINTCEEYITQCVIEDTKLRNKKDNLIQQNINNNNELNN
jgi:DNA repair exonuclease SbcCD ATPase subunit